jgi:hypothetical protein
MEVKAAHAGVGSERIDGWHVFGGLNGATRLRHGHDTPFAEGRFVRSAPFARSKPCPFGIVARRMNWTFSRRAGRAAHVGRQ